MLHRMEIAAATPKKIAAGIELIDIGFGRPARGACYLVRGEREVALVESGTAATAARVLAAVEAAGVDREALKYVIVTHVHLDHAGGAGLLLRAFPHAEVVAHPRGARHLIDPGKLLAGATAVYGAEVVARTFGVMVPVPQERVVEAPDGLVLDVGGRPLLFLDAPGHARHHFVVYDEQSQGFFTGDAFGVSYREFDSPRGAMMFPTTSPVQFDPLAMHASIDRMLGLKPERMYLTHFGMVSGNLEHLADSLHRTIDALVDVAESQRDRVDGAALRAGVTRVLLEVLARHGSEMPADRAAAFWATDLELTAQGLEVWLGLR